jgi:hypothetical protein
VSGYGSRQRLKLWGILLVVLGGAVALLVGAIGRDDPTPPTPRGLRIQVLDEAGVPVGAAVAFVRRKDGALASGAGFDPGTGTLSLPAEDRGARVLLGAPGHRIARLESAETSRSVILERGLVVRLRMTGDAPPLDPPLVGLFRVRPTDETASLGEGEGTRPIDLAELMQRVYRTRDAEMELPTERFGFAVSEDDAASGFRVPVPGAYRIVWGMLDEGPGTWFRLEDGPELTIDVRDTAEPQVFDVEISRPVWNRTREGLAERVEQLRAGAGGG